MPEIFKEDLGSGRGLWSSEDTYRQALSTALLGADWAQTRSIAKGIPGIHETNKLLGQHPSVGMVNNYFAASALADAVIASQLPPEWRKIFQYGTIGLEAPTVGRNKFVFNIGMKF